MIFTWQTIDPNFTTKLSNSTGKFPEIWKEAPTIDKFAMQRLDELEREVKELKQQLEELKNNN